MRVFSPARPALRPAVPAMLVSALLMAGAGPGATPARADQTDRGIAPARLVIEGRAAQALHCSAMLFMVAGVLYDSGFIPRGTRDDAQRAALIMLDHVPGTDRQRVQAMTQRFNRIIDSRSPRDLVREYERSDRWCRRTFLPL